MYRTTRNAWGHAWVWNVDRPSVDKFWANFNLFLKDLRSAGIRYVFPLAGIDNFGYPAPTASDDPDPALRTSRCSNSFGFGSTVYFTPWWPWGYVKDEADNYVHECAGEPNGYILGRHPTSTIFWGWTPYYNFLRKMFQAIHDAQLQMTEYDILPELEINQFPDTARMIQDNAGIDPETGKAATS